MTFSHGLTASPSGKMVVFDGAGSARLLRITPKAIKSIASYAVDFRIYTCLFTPDGKVWIAGEHGRICEIDPTSSKASLRDIAPVRGHVNMMSLGPSGDQAFIVGQHGLAVALDRSGRRVADRLPKRSFKTAAGVRAQLVDVASDELIRRIIFEPATLTDKTCDDLAEHVGVPSFLACAVAPSLHLLAVATDESTVILLDTRDRQIVQELDVGFGYSSMVAGVCAAERKSATGAAA